VAKANWIVVVLRMISATVLWLHSVAVADSVVAVAVAVNRKTARAARPSSEEALGILASILSAAVDVAAVAAGYCSYCYYDCIRRWNDIAAAAVAAVVVTAVSCLTHGSLNGP
jgi:hypothetical protein